MGAPIRVLLIAGDLAPWKLGGIATVVRDLAKALAETPRVEVSLLGTLPHGATLPHEVYGTAVHDRCVRRARLPQPLRRVALQLGYVREYSRWRAEGRARDVVHTHLLPGFKVYPIIRRALREATPVVQSVHGWYPLEMPYYARSRTGHRLHWWLAQTLLSDVKVMTVSSAWMASLVAGRWPTHDIRVVPSAIGDGAGFWDVPPPMVSSPITYFFWGELSALKGPRLVIEAAARLRNLASDLTFRVWIGGSGSCGPELRALVRRLNLDSAVVLLGPLMVEEVIERLASTDVVTLPSAHEGFGMAILEAMAAGRPVITTSGGGGAELIRSRSEGITVPRTVEAITDAMLLLGRDAALRRSVGDAARRRARDFTWRRSVQLLLEAYEAALAQSDGGAR